MLQDKDKYDTGIFVYLSNKKDRNSTIKRLGKTVGTPMFFDCHTQYVKL